jgi:hypothetical protein
VKKTFLWYLCCGTPLAIRAVRVIVPSGTGLLLASAEPRMALINYRTQGGAYAITRSSIFSIFRIFRFHSVLLDMQ